jgi:hypothetical protein
VHRPRSTEVPADFGDDSGLSAGQSKRQLCQQPTFHRIVAQWRRANLISLGPRARQGELLGNEFIQNDSPPWRTLTVVFCGLRRGIGWQWGVEGFDSLGKLWQCKFSVQIGRNRLVEVGFTQGIPDRRPQRRLTNPRNGRVNRRQPVGQWCSFVIGPNRRMDHFKTKETAANQPVG